MIRTICRDVYYRYFQRLPGIKRNVKCNICYWGGKSFHDYIAGPDSVYKESTCPCCGSQPRHRAFYIYLSRILPKSKNIKLLHFAPEKCLKGIWPRYKNLEYVSVDIKKDRAMQVEDITRLSFRDSAFDVILCSHVLEHIEDDRKAINELCRVLKKGGLALIDVPIDYSRSQTYEDPNIITPEDRTKAYWQFDHVRLYGTDFPTKLEGTGFIVNKIFLKNTLGAEEMTHYGIEDVPLYSCTK